MLSVFTWVAVLRPVVFCLIGTSFLEWERFQTLFARLVLRNIIASLINTVVFDDRTQMDRGDSVWNRFA